MYGMELIDYEIVNGVITIETYSDDIKVSKKDFSQWLEDSGHLNWVIDSEENGEHQQKEGQISIGHYWAESYKSDILKDLQEYLNQILITA